jgi:hypothetical protein
MVLKLLIHLPGLGHFSDSWMQIYAPTAPAEYLQDSSLRCCNSDNP